MVNISVYLKTMSEDDTATYLRVCYKLYVSPYLEVNLLSMQKVSAIKD